MYKKGFGTNISLRWQKPFITLVSCQVYILPCTHKGFLLEGIFHFGIKGIITHPAEKNLQRATNPLSELFYLSRWTKAQLHFISFALFFFSFCSLKLLTVTTRSKEKELTRGNALLFSFCQLFPSTFARGICTANSKAIKAWNTPSQARRGSQIKFSIVFKMCYLIM